MRTHAPNLAWHPYASVFPMLDTEELQALADDIAKNGQRHAIVLDAEGRILDGRNRSAACTLAGVEPVCEAIDVTDAEALAFVISSNLHRRHLTESQRAMVAAKIANMDVGKPSSNSANLQNKNVSQSDAAKLLNVSTRSVAEAKKVLNEACPELVHAVESGEVAVSLASKVVDAVPDKKQQAKDAKAGKAALREAVKEASEPRVIPIPVEPQDAGRCVTSLADLAGEKFATIYADPPWSYGNQGTRAATDRHYVTMSVADICAMPVADLAADNAQLHLWTTSGFLREAFTVMEAWGFQYRSGFIWCKSRDADTDDMTAAPKAKLGIGNYWRLSHEYLLLGIRGSATFVDKSLASWVALDRGRHSKKPAAIRAMVERAFHGPRLELFGRQAEPGWTVFGNEVERTLLAQ